MKKKRKELRLKELNITSFVTEINQEEKETIQGATMATPCALAPAKAVTTIPCSVFFTVVVTSAWLTKQTAPPPQGNCPPPPGGPGCGAGASCIDKPGGIGTCGPTNQPPIGIQPPQKPGFVPDPSGFGLPCNSDGGTCETEPPMCPA